MNYDVIIIGGGPAGLSAAIYSTRYELKTLVIAKQIGGYVNYSPVIENYLGIPNVKGFELVNKFKDHAKSLGAELIEEEVLEISKDLIVKTNKNEYQAKSIIFATGSEKRKLNVPGEKEFLGKGVSYCATCDGPLFKNRTVAVAGGGDSAKITALMLTEYVEQVHMLVREDHFIGKECLSSKVKENKKIQVHFNTIIEEIKGNNFVEEINCTGKENVKVNGIFVEIGLIPNNKLAKELNIKLDKKGLIDVTPGMKTNRPGVFAAGDITNGSDEFRQDITAASEGAIAANSAYHEMKK
jgi:thioredoxin reductase (NADPH)